MLLQAEIFCAGQTIRTTDTPEGIGPWIALMFAALQPGPYDGFRVSVSA